MRHGKKINHLGRKSAHRKAMLSNMATSLILHKRISTTVAKAKALRKYVEPLITKAKDNSTHSRRMVFSYLNHKEPIKELFDVVAAKVGDRPGGYTRIIKTGTRLGDNAETCIIELVDFNEIYVKEEQKKTRRKRTRRSGGSGQPASEAAPKTEAVEEKAEEVVEDVKEEVVETETAEEVKEEVVEEEKQEEAENIEVKDEASDEAPKEEEKKEDK
jgi:large subunit ribosomal protein L17